jgi:hypothetical protein
VITTRPDPDLVWYFCDSASELGMHAQALSDDGLTGGNWPEQRWPSARMCQAARRQREIREALRQLADNLQSVLECVYSAQGLTVQERFVHDLAAPLVARAISLARHASATDRLRLSAFVERAPVLLDAAHAAFRIAYGKPEPRSRPELRRQQVRRWLVEEGIAS